MDRNLVSKPLLTSAKKIIKLGGSMLASIKWFTQRTTKITLVLLWLLVIPGLLLTLLIRTGAVSWVDTLYRPSPVGFWIFFLLTRAIFGGGWIFTGISLQEKGTQNGFFWFKPMSDWDKSYYAKKAQEEKENVDKSSELFIYTAGPLLVLFFSEFLLRLFSGTTPPYLPPPNN